MYSTYADMEKISSYLMPIINIINNSHISVNYVVTETMESSKPFKDELTYAILLYEIIINLITLLTLLSFFINFIVVSNAGYFLIQNINNVGINIDIRNPDCIGCLAEIKNYLNTYTVYYAVILGLSISTYVIKKGEYVSNYIEALCFTLYIFIILAIFSIALRKLLILVQNYTYKELTSIESQIYLAQEEGNIEILDKKRKILRDIAEDFSLRKNLLPYLSGLASFATLLYITLNIIGIAHLNRIIYVKII